MANPNDRQSDSSSQEPYKLEENPFEPSADGSGRLGDTGYEFGLTPIIVPSVESAPLTLEAPLPLEAAPALESAPSLEFPSRLEGPPASESPPILEAPPALESPPILEAPPTGDEVAALEVKAEKAATESSAAAQAASERIALSSFVGRHDSQALNPAEERALIEKKVLGSSGYDVVYNEIIRIQAEKQDSSRFSEVRRLEDLRQDLVSGRLTPAEAQDGLDILLNPYPSDAQYQRPVPSAGAVFLLMVMAFLLFLVAVVAMNNNASHRHVTTLESAQQGETDWKFLPVSSLGSITSADSGPEVEMQLENKTKHPLKLIPINSTGHLGMPLILEPAKVTSQHTYAGQLWVLETRKGRRLALLLAGERKVFQHTFKSSKKD